MAEELEPGRHLVHPAAAAEREQVTEQGRAR
jgi:hypothetical protein